MASSSIRRNRIPVRNRRLTVESLEKRQMLTVVAPVANPGFSYVDANNDGLYEAGTDVPLNNGELNGGSFDTRVPAAPDYTTVIPGAGLVIDTPVTAANISLKADGNLVIGTNLTSTGTPGNNSGNIALLARQGSVGVDGLAFYTFTATNNINVKAGDGVNLNQAALFAGSTPPSPAIAASHVSTEQAFEQGHGRNWRQAPAGPGQIDLESDRGGLSVDAATLQGTAAIILDSDGKGSLSADDALIEAGGNASLSTDWGDISAMGTLIYAGGTNNISFFAGGSIDIGPYTVPNSGPPPQVNPSLFAVGGGISLSAFGDITLTNASLLASNAVNLNALDSVFADGSLLEAATGNVDIDALTDIAMQNARVRAENSIDIGSLFGSIDLTGADVAIDSGGTTSSRIGVHAGLFGFGKITVAGATFTAPNTNNVKLLGRLVGGPPTIVAGTEPLI